MSKYGVIQVLWYGPYMVWCVELMEVCYHGIIFPKGEDFNIIQQEIAILSECKSPNIVGYYGSYLR